MKTATLIWTKKMYKISLSSSYKNNKNTRNTTNSSRSQRYSAASLAVVAWGDNASPSWTRSYGRVLTISYPRCGDEVGWFFFSLKKPQNVFFWWRPKGLEGVSLRTRRFQFDNLFEQMSEWNVLQKRENNSVQRWVITFFSGWKSDVMA